ncbi:MAG: CDP-diacylglycerol diphosphatase [Alphaproteobacteria bacterium]|nr:CDP-diacylglycerol diphosphatase [Alphaproteobacteria bacterium]
MHRRIHRPVGLAGVGISRLMLISAAMLAWISHHAGGQVSAAGTPSLQAHPTNSCVVAPRPNSLWSLAQCCSRSPNSNPGCREYNPGDKYIILKDNSARKPAAYLIVPTFPVTGIDDKQIFLPPIVDFWHYGWQHGQSLIGKPAAELALAINSARGRTQNQLHIHIACVSPTVARALARDADTIGTNPATAVRLALGPADHIYRIIKTTDLSGAASPFNLVAMMPGARADMGNQSIAVVGSPTPDTYYVLETSAGHGNPGAAEELLDQSRSCNA